MTEQTTAGEYREITPECRTNRGDYPAFDQAAHDLWHVYGVMLSRHPDATFVLALSRKQATPATDRECSASISGRCLREAQSETACDTDDGECVYGGKPATDHAGAVASCPGYETTPNPCRCPCYGCKHHCAAHNPDALAIADALPAPVDRADVLLGAAEPAEHPRLNLTPLRAEALAADEVFVDPATFRATVLREAADAIDAETRQAKAHEVLEPDKYRPCRDASAQLRRMADEPASAVVVRRATDETPGARHAPGTAILCPDCRTKGHSVCMDGAAQQPKGA